MHFKSLNLARAIAALEDSSDDLELDESVETESEEDPSEDDVVEVEDSNESDSESDEDDDSDLEEESEDDSEMEEVEEIPSAAVSDLDDAAQAVIEANVPEEEIAEIDEKAEASEVLTDASVGLESIANTLDASKFESGQKSELYVSMLEYAIDGFIQPTGLTLSVDLTGDVETIKQSLLEKASTLITLANRV